MQQRKGANSGALNAWVRAMAKTGAVAKSPAVTLPVLVQDLADVYADRPALLSADSQFTYRDLANRTNQYARWALGNDVRPGDVICLLMPNCPEYVAIWLGISYVQGVVALINTNLTDDALVHSINVVSTKHIIVDASLAPAVKAAITRLPPGVHVWMHGANPSCEFPRIDLCVNELPAERLGVAEQRPQSITNRALHIYTSGTTGLPKAANISHYRLLEWSYWFAGMMDTGPTDRMYNCLPMYHSTGGVVAIGALLVAGGSVMIRPVFSASRFWDDIVANECTMFQYIGELCRYLLNTPPHPSEAQHQLRLVCGNGLQPDIWEAFQQRFRIPRILEFYASTEGNVSLYNCEGKPGAIGHVPSFLAHRFPVSIIRCDESGNPVRDGNGFCIRVPVNEPGEAIGKIAGGDGPHASGFEGYTDRAASETKVLRNVFADGDLWFRTGDLMRKDAAGFFYFVDRLGDTFRWKGENVSTTQVAQAICTCPGIQQAIVYGVAVPGTDGKAGMSAIIADPDFAVETLHQHLSKCLPSYARPVFVRVGKALQMTGTFKPTKAQFIRDGYDPNETDDIIYFDDRPAGAYVRLDRILYTTIQNVGIRL